MLLCKVCSFVFNFCDNGIMKKVMKVGTQMNPLGFPKRKSK